MSFACLDAWLAFVFEWQGELVLGMLQDHTYRFFQLSGFQKSNLIFLANYELSFIQQKRKYVDTNFLNTNGSNIVKNRHDAKFCHAVSTEQTSWQFYQLLQHNAQRFEGLRGFFGKHFSTSTSQVRF